MKVSYIYAPDHFEANFCVEKEDLGWIDKKPGMTLVFYLNQQYYEGRTLCEERRS